MIYLLESIKLNQKQITKLVELLNERNIGVLDGKSEYEIFRVDRDDLFLILYNTGKLIFKKSDVFDELYDEIFQLETGYEYIFGSDEAGKGEWYGPLIVCCVGGNQKEFKKLRKLGVKDSKNISLAKINELESKITQKKNIIITKVILPPLKLNQLWTDFKKEGKNYNDLLAWAHSKAIKEALMIFRDEYKTDKQIKVFIDKFDENKMDSRLTSLDYDKIDVVQKISGESEIAVAAASIIAKKIFEDYLKKLETEFAIKNIKNIDPKSLDVKILPLIAKIHFNNISKIIEKR